MKALSLTQPYAEIIRVGIKKIETRSWKTNYRGRIYIHATSGKPVKDPALMDLVKEKDLDYGKIICSANLVDCVEMTPEFIEEVKKNHDEYVAGIYEVGRYGWILEDVQPVEPFEIKGHLGLWEAK